MRAPTTDHRPRVLTIIGTRPEGIKLAPVIGALQRSAHLDSCVAVTGQHTDMLDQVLRLFDVHPEYDLELMREGQDLHDVAVGCLDGLRGVIADAHPAVVIVQGDTATACFGAIAAFMQRVAVGHVEAGLRSGAKWSPFPEEIFRRLTDVVSDFYFAPTPRAIQNLRREAVPDDRLFLTGNTVIDALWNVVTSDHTADDAIVRRLLAGTRRLVLVTIHRREAFGPTLVGMLDAVRRLSEEHPNTDFILPVHPNPNVKGPAHAVLGSSPGVHLVDPLGYVDLVRVMHRSSVVLTDSGGIQEEAPSLGIPVLVLREVTERPEGVEAGVVELVGTAPDAILAAARKALAGPVRPTPSRAPHSNPYGDGRAASRIVDILEHHLCGHPRRTTEWSGVAALAHGENRSAEERDSLASPRVAVRAGDPLLTDGLS